MDKKMLFVFNPKAGKGKIKANLLDIVDIFNKGGYEVIIYSTQKPKDAYEKAKEYSGLKHFNNPLLFNELYGTYIIFLLFILIYFLLSNIIGR